MFHYWFFFNIFFFLLVCFFLCIFLLNSFYYLKFSSEVIQKLWNIFFLIVCFLMNVGTCIKSSKEKLLPILKNLFRLFTKIFFLCLHVTYVHTSLFFFFTLSVLFGLFYFNYSCFSAFNHSSNQHFSHFWTKIF